jgi:hypothetical protein
LVTQPVTDKPAKLAASVIARTAFISQILSNGTPEGGGRRRGIIAQFYTIRLIM